MPDNPTITEADVLSALGTVQDPELGGDVYSRNRVRGVRLAEDRVAVTLAHYTPGTPYRKQMDEQVRVALGALPGAPAVEVDWVLDVPGRRVAEGDLIPGVRNMVAVGSGKGGVGKSTVAANLAVALAMEGARVGLLDADVYGPSVPTMLGIRQPPATHQGKMVPLERHGVRLMSLGFLMPEESAHVIWRGPMVGSAVRQMLADCEWGDLDYLVVDLPPGTGDAQLTLAQSVPLTGAAVVMTSQDVAVKIASKAVGMFQKLNVPILGVVGNMDEFVCPHCHHQTPIFTHGGSETAAEKLGVPFLGSIPLDPETVEHGDRGVPTVLAAPESAQAQAFRQVALNVALQVTAAHRGAAPGPQDGLGGLFDRFRTG